MNNNNGDSAGLVCLLAAAVVAVAVVVTIWWRIFDKTGYGGGLGLLMLIPVVNLIMLLVLAFGDWPVQQEVRRLRRELAELEEYGRGGGQYGGGSSGFPKRGPEGEGESRYRQ